MKDQIKIRSFGSAEEAMYDYARDRLISKWTIGADYNTIKSALLEACTTVGMSKISEATQLNRSHLYRAFSETGNPTLSTVMAVMKYFNLKFKVERND